MKKKFLNFCIEQNNSADINVLLETEDFASIVLRSQELIFNIILRDQLIDYETHPEYGGRVGVTRHHSNDPWRVTGVFFFSYTQEINMLISCTDRA